MENEQGKGDHVIDMLLICRNIMRITYEGIKSGVFKIGGDDAVALARSILTETRNVLDYRRQRKIQEIRIRHTQ